MYTTFLRLALSLLITLLIPWGVLGQTTRFIEDLSAFPNPERGFYSHQRLDELDESTATLRSENGITLVWGKISLEPYRETRAIPEAFLARLQGGFDLAQKAGVKVIVRAEYGHIGPGGDYKSYEDPAKEIIEGHMEQLAPLFTANADRIAFFEAGFVGPWGEWHSTLITRDPKQQREVYFHLLKNTPTDRMVVLRYPALKQSIFGTTAPLTAAQAYDGSPMARTGHHNDCFLSSANDVGTYNRGGQEMSEELAYLHEETRYTLFGGETCQLHDRSKRESALFELEHLHASFLNSGYHPDVLARWRKSGVFDIVERRLGARLQVTAFDLPESARAGQQIPVRLAIVNRGFASLYNARSALLVLIGPDGSRLRFPLEVDPRQWKAGETTEVTTKITLPLDLAAARYSWGLSLPDPSPRLAGDARFSYRLANLNAWDEATGENVLITNWPLQAR